MGTEKTNKICGRMQRRWRTLVITITKETTHWINKVGNMSGTFKRSRLGQLCLAEPARQRPPQSNAAKTKKANWITVVIKTKCNKNFAGLLQRTGEMDSLAIAMVGLVDEDWGREAGLLAGQTLIFAKSYVKLVTNDLSNNWISTNLSELGTVDDWVMYNDPGYWELLQHVRSQEDWMGQDSIADDTPMKINMRDEAKTKYQERRASMLKAQSTRGTKNGTLNKALNQQKSNQDRFNQATNEANRKEKDKKIWSGTEG
ncbi:hypothetical protein BY996DRAFT_6537985 [Phakopsora pachyrhizi]|nr:hypothetical protein BY996DRAFT_6537985 [Phakopsora pachyrhizi]